MEQELRGHIQTETEQSTYMPRTSGFPELGEVAWLTQALDTGSTSCDSLFCQTGTIQNHWRASVKTVWIVLASRHTSERSSCH